ncbi:MAG: TetR family transcriptional regulator [Arthrobacter sp.]|nr:TetR family transcriptional regulator [Arthrobacter sp.]MDZ4353436.1 TetR family transcriptional regulator [Arthrobacter sp.]
MADTGTPKALRGRPVVVTAEQIEAVALRLWSERGFHEVSVADIAAEAGVTARTIFRRYPTKADMVWGPLAASFRILTDALEQTSPQAPLFERARTALVDMIRDGDVDPTARHRIRIVGRTPELQSSTSAPFRLWRQNLYDFAAAQPGVDTLRAQVFAWSVQSTALAGLIWWVTEEPGTAPWQAVDEAFAQLLD